MALIAPSILSADFSKLRKEIEAVDEAEYLHIDVMDGNFVPNITIGPLVIESIRPYSKAVFDTHLMIEKPQRYIEEFAEAGSDIITFHVEAVRHLDRVIHQVKESGCQVGVALNPATPLAVLDYVLDELDMVLLMTVNPGFGGQSFIPVMYKKIKKLREIIDKNKYKTRIQIDGGVNLDNISTLVEAGVDIFVSGSTIFKSQNPDEIIRKMKNY